MNGPLGKKQEVNETHCLDTLHISVFQLTIELSKISDSLFYEVGLWDKWVFLDSSFLLVFL